MEAKQFKKLVKESGIKQSFIADKLNVSRALVSQWARGYRPIAERHLYLLKKMLS